MSDQLITEAFLPGLRCLRNDIQAIAHEYEDAVNNMIQEFEAKLDLGRSIERFVSYLIYFFLFYSCCCLLTLIHIYILAKICLI